MKSAYTVTVTGASALPKRRAPSCVATLGLTTAPALGAAAGTA